MVKMENLSIYNYCNKKKLVNFKQNLLLASG